MAELFPLICPDPQAVISTVLVPVSYIDLHMYLPYGNERVKSHSTKPCIYTPMTSHLQAYDNERVNPQSTKPCVSPTDLLCRHLHAYCDECVNPHTTKPCLNIIDLHVHAFGHAKCTHSPLRLGDFFN